MNNLLTLILSLIGSFFLLINIIPFLGYDIPNERSSHQKPVSRGGGIIFIISSIVSIPISGSYYFLFLLPLGFVGFLDDIYSLSSKLRYFVQLFTVALITLFDFDYFSNMESIFFKIFALFFFILLGTTIINFSNFMDGIDGLLTSTMIIVFFNIAFINNVLYLYPILGSLIAFLYFNKSPAKVFMGDVGSTFLGGLLFLAIVKAGSFEKAFYSLAVAFPLFLDAFVCLVRRFISKENIFKPHKKHLYQRLVKSGISHPKVTLIYSICCIIISIACLTGNFINVFFSLMSIVIFGVIIDKYIAEPFQT